MPTRTPMRADDGAPPLERRIVLSDEDLPRLNPDADDGEVPPSDRFYVQRGNRRVLRLPAYAYVQGSHGIKLSEPTAEKILLALRAGASRNLAAQWSGVTYQTFKVWMDRTEPRFIAFQLLVQEAEAYPRVNAVTKVTTNPDWRAARAFLEVKDPEWAAAAQRRNTNETQVGVGVNVDLGAMLQRIHDRRRNALPAPTIDTDAEAS